MGAYAIAHGAKSYLQSLMSVWTMGSLAASGATLALALIFLKSNNASVAAQFRVPASTYELHCVRREHWAERCA